MLQEITEKFEDVFRKLKGQGKISEKHLADGMREIRRVLLEADVNYKVAKQFVADVQEKALGADVVKSITPAQQIIKIVHDELVLLIGGSSSPLKTANIPPTVIMVVGLQGSGKTTFCGKLANQLKAQGKKPLLIGADLQRPAAVEQLKTVGRQIGVDSYSDLSTTPLSVCKAGFSLARQKGCDVIVLDTAGRLHVDEALMQELQQIKGELKPHETLFVADGMTGQDAVNAATVFLEKIDFSGIVLTKMDGDARGGAALSIKAVTNRPIKYIGTGEKLDALEIFHPDRVASRILGMGDIVSLVEKAQQNIDHEQAAKLEKKLRRAEFTLEDFYDQIQQVKKMGPLSQLIGMIPGAGGKALGNVELDDRALVRIEAMINSMTPDERRRPQVINGSRRSRIAKGSGTTVQDLNRLLKQFFAMQKMMKQFSKKGFKGKMQIPFM
ncbi:MAG: signal recognition particle protein [Deferribacteres bacterium]|nr:signal recognition particle protein [candidate division KSB1 bacterium]MCB9510457.1 signal recognition particle protein [Deferribacteres bacterium]